MRVRLRALARNPGFAALCVLSLAAGIGLATALASVADAILFRPLPVPDPDRIVRIFTSSAEQAQGPVSYRDFMDFRRASRSMDGTVAETQVLLAVGGDGGPASAGGSDNPGAGNSVASVRLGLAVTADYFEVLQVRPALGRAFHADESHRPVVVLSDAFWRSECGADRGVLGRSIRIGGVPFTVLGVAPKDFGLERFVHESFYVPFGAYESGILPNGGALEDGSRRFLTVYGRLAKPTIGSGLSLGSARAESSLLASQAEFSMLASQLEAAYPETNRGRRAIVLTESQARVRADRTMPTLAWFLIGMAIVVLAIATANVAGLSLARAEARGREVAVRLALGATAARLLADFLIEAAVLSASGAALGVPMAGAAIKLLARTATLPTDFPFAIAPRLDARVGLIAALASGLAAIVCGCTPALVPMLAKRRIGIGEALRSTSSQTAGNRTKTRSALVAIEVALATGLTAVGGSLIGSVKSATKIDPGYRSDHVLTMALDPSQLGYSPTRTRAFYGLLLDRVRRISGVRGAALAQSAMLGYTRAEAQVHCETETGPGFGREGDGAAGQGRHPVALNTVTPGYVGLLRLPMIAGRAFDDRDTDASTPVAIVNQELARRCGMDLRTSAPVTSPLVASGSRIRVNGRLLQIVGVARDAKYFELHEAARPYLYLPFSQNFAARMVLHVETAGAPANATRRILDEIHAIDPAQPVSEIRPLSDYLDQGAMFSARVGMDLTGAAGACGMGLALAGIYGVISHSAARRRKEIGIRMALGAGRVNVVGLIARDALALIAIGASGGIIIAVAANRLLTAVAPGIQGLDGWSLAGVAVVVLAGLIAAVVPAWRGSAVDPASALRQD
jgi:predicted permease